jgi:hypothetical protein
MLISVCVKAKDLTEALHAADMLKSTGQKLDTILYTNLMTGAPLLPLRFAIPVAKSRCPRIVVCICDVSLACLC